MWSYSLLPLAAGEVTVFYRPVLAVTSQWTPSSGSNNAALVNETIVSDTDYVFAVINNRVDEYTLNVIPQPPVNTNVILRARIRTSGVVAVKVALYSGATLVQESSNLTSPSNFTTVDFTISYATWSAASINWANLRIRITSVV